MVEQFSINLKTPFSIAALKAKSSVEWAGWILRPDVQETLLKRGLQKMGLVTHVVALLRQDCVAGRSSTIESSHRSCGTTTAQYFDPTGAGLSCEGPVAGLSVQSSNSESSRLSCGKTATPYVA
ncbi:MAG: hypothetical protein ACU0GG_10445 [Paracoccaceae bacterium]